ncbi:MAG: hypothetical protein ACR2IE_16510 [Candidatus Sumerlaeaceae bacterium]
MSDALNGKGFVAGRTNLPVDPVIEAYKKDVDRTLIRQNLSRNMDQRMQGLQQMLQLYAYGQRRRAELRRKH